MRGGVALLVVVAAATAAIVFGAAADQRLAAPPSAPPSPSPAGAPGPAILATPAESLADLPEVWAATAEGDLLPSDASAVGPMPDPRPLAALGQPEAAQFTRIPAPRLTGPRRVGIQAGHWLTELAPPGLSRLFEQTGTSWAGVNEVDINLDVAWRIEKIIEARGVEVDVLPVTIPQGYVADAFVSLHGDGDGVGEISGFKLAHSPRRTPYEAELLESIKQHYVAATGLAYDGEHISRDMVSYYLFAWQRNVFSTAPHTPSVILEMGYVSSDHDRELMTERADLVAAAISEGILRFLDAHPRDTLFGKDLLVPNRPRFAPPSPTPQPAG